MDYALLYLYLCFSDDRVISNTFRGSSYDMLVFVFLRNRVQLFKEKIRSCRRKFFPLRDDPFFVAGVSQNLSLC